MTVLGAADGRVHGRVVDRATLDAPLLQHLLVAAVVDEALDRVRDRLGEVGLVLGDDVAVGRGVVDVAEQFELAVGLGDRVRHDRRVGQAGDVLAGDDRGGGLVLPVVLVDGDGFLARRGALLGARGDVVDLHGRLLHRDPQATGVLRVDLLRVALLRRPLRAGGVVADHVGLLQTIGVDGERGDARLVLARADAGDDRVEGRRLELRLQAQLLGDEGEQVDVEADDRRAVLGEELAGRVGGVAAHRDDAVGLDRIGHHRGQALVGGHARQRRAAGGAAPAGGFARAAAASGEDESGAGDGRGGGGRTTGEGTCRHGLPPVSRCEGFDLAPGGRSVGTEGASRTEGLPSFRGPGHSARWADHRGRARRARRRRRRPGSVRCHLGPRRLDGAAGLRRRPGTGGGRAGGRPGGRRRRLGGGRARRGRRRAGRLFGNGPGVARRRGHRRLGADVEVEGPDRQEQDGEDHRRGAGAAQVRRDPGEVPAAAGGIGADRRRDGRLLGRGLAHRSPSRPSPSAAMADVVGGGTFMPWFRNARTTRARRFRPTSNCLPGSVRATIRTLTWSRSRLSTPMRLGGSSNSGRSAGSRNASRPTSRRILLTRLTSTLVGTGTSTTARAQSRDRLTTLTICPLGTVTTSPSEERTRVTRSVTSSTVPVAASGAPTTLIETTSPKPYWRSVMMKKPARTSPTIRCAPQPTPTPSTVAGATRPVTGTPSRSRTKKTAIE